MIGYHTSHLNDKRKAARKTRSRPSISDSDMHGLCDISAQVSLCNVLINHLHHHLRSSASHPCGGEARFPPLIWWRCTLLRFRPDQKPRQALSLSITQPHTHDRKDDKQINKQRKPRVVLVFFSFLLWLMESSVHLTLPHRPHI